MNMSRKSIVMKAFKSLDKSGSGTILVDDIKDLYNASNHPDVTSKKRTEDDVLTEFLDTFELYCSLMVIGYWNVESGFAGW